MLAISLYKSIQSRLIYITMAKTIRFLILSETHNFEFQDYDADTCPLQAPPPRVDVVLRCGDLTHCGSLSSYKKALKMLGAFEAELKLFMAGNHDLELDKDFWRTHLDESDEEEDHSRAMAIMTGELARDANVTYLEEGTYRFVLSCGATFTLYASSYSPKFCDRAFSYEHVEDRFNEADQVAKGAISIAKSPIPRGVDIVMTHGPPKGILDECSHGHIGCGNVLRREYDR